MSAENFSRRLYSLLNMDLFDPLLEAMIDGVFVPGGGSSVSVEFNFLPFVVDEGEMEHSWRPGPMDVDNYADDDTRNDEDKDDDDERHREEDDDEDDDEDDENDDEEDEEEEGLPLFSDYGDEYNDNYDDEEEEEDYIGGGVDDDDDENEEENLNGYSSQHEDEENEHDNDLAGNNYDDDDEEEDAYDDDGGDDYDDDDLHLAGMIDESVRENYGRLGYTICHNIIHREILRDTFNSRYFLRHLAEHFFTHLKQESSVTSSSILQKLLSCLPPLPDLKHVITKTKYTLKEAIIIKVVLELYENYHRRYGAPNFKIYHTEVIPLILDFYNRFPNAALKLMSSHLKRVLLNLKYLTDNFTLFHTKQEYLTHYADVTRKVRNLSEGTDSSLFLR